MEKVFLKIRRESYLNKIRPFYHSKYIKVITGLRRCGKSELLNQIKSDLIAEGVLNDQIISIDLETEKFTYFKTGKQIFSFLHKRIINDKKYYIFIDEIQHISKFEIVIAAIRNTYNCSLFVTGSNSRLLHGKLQDRLTGRAKEFEIYPFSFSELIEFKQINHINVKSDTDELNDYIKWGGLPQLYEETNDDDRQSYLVDLFYSIIQKDVFGIHKRIDKELFIKLSKYILTSCGKIFSALSIAKQLKQLFKIKDIKSFSKNINSYADCLIQSYFIKECWPIETGTKRSLLGWKKFYNIDNGFKYALNDISTFENTFALENTIFNELIFQGYKVFYGKHNGKEIDFIAIKDQKQYFIQVTYSLSNPDNLERELAPFSAFKNTSNKFILSLDTLDMSYKDIKHINIVNFLTHKVKIE